MIENLQWVFNHLQWIFNHFQWFSMDLHSFAMKYAMEIFIKKTVHLRSKIGFYLLRFSISVTMVFNERLNDMTHGETPSCLNTIHSKINVKSFEYADSKISNNI